MDLMQHSLDYQYLTVVIDLFTMLVQVLTMYLSVKMERFARKYGKLWARAFIVFFVAMAIIALRRGIDLAICLKWLNGFSRWIFLFDRLVLIPAYSIMFVIFQVMIFIWWKYFFGTYLKDIYRKAEEKIPEDLFKFN